MVDEKYLKKFRKLAKVNINESKITPISEAEPVTGDTETSVINNTPASDVTGDTANNINTMEPEIPQPINKSADEIQNEILGHQIDAIKKIASKIDQLDSNLDDINMSLNYLGKEVDNVREPSPMEKLQNKANDSSPFKYTLSDIWDGNTFQGRKDLFYGEDENIKTSDDGTLYADFDKLPKMSDVDIAKSFEIYESFKRKINENSDIKFNYDNKGNWIPSGHENKMVAAREVEQPIGSGNKKVLIVSIDNNGGVKNVLATKDNWNQAKSEILQHI